MEDSTDLQILSTAAENGQDETQFEPESESKPSSPLNTPDLGVADPAPARKHVKKSYPRRGYFDVRDASKVETVMTVLSIVMYIANFVFFVSSFFVSGHQYAMAYIWLLTASNILCLFDKWYRVQGGFDYFISLLSDFQPGVYALIFSLWGNNWKVLLAVNVFSLFFDFINMAIQYFPSYVKIPIKGNVKKFLRANQFRDRYEDIGISGLLPCNEATNKMKESRIKFDNYYTLWKVDHDETPVSDEETGSDEEIDDNDVETPAETLASLRAQKKIRWIIGTMMVSYSDNDDWVTIKQRAEERAVKIFMEHFTPQQKLNFIEMMEAWKKRPSQGILKKIGRKRSHCFTLARLIDLTKQGFSVYSEKMELRTIKVGAEEDTGVEDFIDSIRKVLEVVYSRVALQKAIIVAIIAVIVMFNRSTV